MTIPNQKTKNSSSEKNATDVFHHAVADAEDAAVHETSCKEGEEESQKKKKRTRIGHQQTVVRMLEM